MINILHFLILYKKREYKLGDRINRGAYGEVRSVNRSGSLSPLVIKINNNPEYYPLAIRESGNFVNAPHEIRIRDSFKYAEGIHAIVMDRVPSPDLHDLLFKSSVHLNFDQIISIAYQLLEYLVYLEKKALLPGESAVKQGI